MPYNMVYFNQRQTDFNDKIHFDIDKYIYK